ncbi:MAG: hypothetical protein ACYDA2_04695 [Acidimicrobiales bacterium]
MFVSKKQQSVVVDDSVTEALGWLQRELAWESVLNSLRRAAGVPLAEPAAGPRRAAA